MDKISGQMGVQAVGGNRNGATGEKIFANARMTGGKAGTSRHAHRKAKFSGAMFTVRSTQRSSGC